MMLSTHTTPADNDNDDDDDDDDDDSRSCSCCRLLLCLLLLREHVWLIIPTEDKMQNRRMNEWIQRKNNQDAGMIWL